MFDLEYKPSGSFIPLVMVVKKEVDTDLNDLAKSEDLEATNKNVENLTESVEAQAETISELAATTAENADAIAENKAAIEELNEKISNVPKFDIKVVDSLPESGEPGTIYLVRDEESGADSNLYREYVYSDGEWEEIGPMIDLTGYAEVEYVDEKDTETLESAKEYADGKFYTLESAQTDLAAKANASDLETLFETVGTLSSEFESVDEKLAGMAQVVAGKANSDDVYTKAEADEKFLTEHQDISGLATKEELQDYAKTSEVTDEIAAASTVIMASVENLSGAVEGHVAEYKDFYKDYKSVKTLVGLLANDTSYALRTNWSASTYAELTALTNGSAAVVGTYNLTKDITGEDTNRFSLNFGTTFGDNLVGKLNLAGHNIETSGWCKNYMIRTTYATNLTVTGGNVTNTNTLSAFTDNILHNPVFVAISASTMTLSLGTSKSAKTLSDDPVVVCQDEATINITNGYYTSPNSCVIYCMGGQINITGGVFRSTAADGPGFLINCLDSAYTAGKANIVVSSTSKSSGPKFWDFNPADNNAEGEHTSFVAEGCGVTTATVTEDEVEHTVYTVVKL